VPRTAAKRQLINSRGIFVAAQSNDNPDIPAPAAGERNKLFPDGIPRERRRKKSSPESQREKEHQRERERERERERDREKSCDVHAAC